MLRERQPLELSEFLRYLASRDGADNGDFPSLTDLSSELGVSVASLREQLEVARALGLVEVKPRVGIRRLPFTFLPAVRQSLGYAIALDDKNFRIVRRSPQTHRNSVLARGRETTDSGRYYRNCRQSSPAHGPSSRVIQSKFLTTNTSSFTCKSINASIIPLSPGFSKPIGKPTRRSD